ncbi:MAG: HD domain-containing protein [Spirochaetota bacterium]|nr:MAG: HD domain-containing protein [Spirochaetota bacterium]
MNKSEWEKNIKKFAETLSHPAWGHHHSERVLKLSIHLAKKQNHDIDIDSIIAASYIHDVGAFPEYRVNDMDHSDRSIDLAEEILVNRHFPVEKIKIVKDVIKGHMFYRKPSSRIESIIFHDSDVLDFMGFIGVTRILAIVGLDDWTPDLKSAVRLIKKFRKELYGKLHTPLAKEIGKAREKEMEQFITKLSSETNDLKYI